MLLNRANAVLGLLQLSKGGISGTVTDLRVLFQAAIKANVLGFVAAHNHPSGNLNPSESDLKLTRKIKDAGVMLDLSFLTTSFLQPMETITASRIMEIYNTSAMEIRCRHCGDYFSPSPETQVLIAEGYISLTSVDSCDECWELIEYSIFLKKSDYCCMVKNSRMTSCSRRTAVNSKRLIY